MSKLRFRPLYDRVLVRRTETIQPTVGAVLQPDTAREKPLEGEVLAVGEGRVSEGGLVTTPLSVHAGDRVLFGKYAGSEIQIGGEELLILREEEIHGILEPEPEPAL